MKFADFVSDPDGRLSEKKLWAQIAKASATAVFVYQGFHASVGDGLSLFMAAYLGLVGGIELASKYLSMRAGASSTTTTTTASTVAETITVPAAVPTSGARPA